MASPLTSHWPLLCGALAALVLNAGLSLGAETCKENTNCSTCVATINNNVSCFWLECQGLNSTCVNNASSLPQNCSASNTSCLDPISTASPSPTSTPSNSSSNSSTEVPPTTLNATTVITSTTTSAHPTGNTNGTTPVPPHKKTSTFDAASFIGGIVLVLGLQAVVFFAVKFCKTKDRNYHTL